MTQASSSAYIPATVMVRLPREVSETLKRIAYETGRSKQDLVLSAIVEKYGKKREANG